MTLHCLISLTLPHAFELCSFCFPSGSTYALPLLSLCPCLECPCPSHLSIHILHIFQDQLTSPSLQSFPWLFIPIHNNLSSLWILSFSLKAGLLFWHWYVLKNTYSLLFILIIHWWVPFPAGLRKMINSSIIFIVSRFQRPSCGKKGKCMLCK